MSLLKNPPSICLSSFTLPHSTIHPFSNTTTLSNNSMFSNLWVITNRVLSYEYLKICLCSRKSVLGSILDDASSKHTISFCLKITLKKLTIYFSPFDRFSPPS